MRQRIYDSKTLPDGKRVVTSYSVPEYIFIVLFGKIFKGIWFLTKLWCWYPYYYSYRFIVFIVKQIIVLIKKYKDNKNSLA